MSPELRPLGLGLSLIGNLAFALGFGRGLGVLSSVDSVSTAVAWSLMSPAVLLAAGYVLIHLAPRFGGGSFGVQFLVIGITSFLGGLHATDGVERFVGIFIGVIFLGVSFAGLVVVGLSSGMRNALLLGHGPMIYVRGAGGPKPLNVGSLRGALVLARQIQGNGGKPPAFTVDTMPAAQRQQVMDELASLRASGQLTDEQLAAIHRWSGLPEESGSGR